MTLSIAERRQITDRAAAEEDFRRRLLQDPRRVTEEVTGRAVSEHVAVITEEDGWEFVLPSTGAYAEELPLPRNPREAIENEALEVLREHPGLREQVLQDPKRFVYDRLGLSLDGEAKVRAEGQNELLLVIPNQEEREVLSDESLDLVAGGGQVGSNCPPATEQPRVK